MVMAKAAVAAVALLCFAGGLLFAQTLQIQTAPEQSAIAGQSFLLPLHATGGAQPYSWQLAGGQLPPGCKLYPRSGRISGVPTTPGDYRFTVAVIDSAIPPMQIQRELTIRVIAGLTLDWKEPPRVEGQAISGSAIVSNQTASDFDLTVIVVAVNQIGRATALGHQHFRLAAHATSQVIAFGATPGPGTYYVRADAAAHRLGHGHIFRASKQTPERMTLAQF